jgi:SAM-dependent methyltransferase
MNDEGAARIRALVQAIGDLAGGPGGKRVLDLGAGDGEIAVELALRGALVTAVEGRLENADLIRALRAERGVSKAALEVLVADVRELKWETLGAFEIVVCSGLLYHLTATDAAELAAHIRDACTRLALIDTEVAWGPLAEESGYSGLRFREEPSPLSSLGNEESFWLTRASLHALLYDAGFSSSFELGAPGQPRREQRATVAALVGERVERLELDPEQVLPEARPAEPAPGRMMGARLRLARLRRR